MIKINFSFLELLYCTQFIVGEAIEMVRFLDVWFIYIQMNILTSCQSHPVQVEGPVFQAI
jgi:hypothetical protein